MSFSPLELFSMLSGNELARIKATAKLGERLRVPFPMLDYTSSQPQSRCLSWEIGVEAVGGGISRDRCLSNQMNSYLLIHLHFFHCSFYVDHHLNHQKLCVYISTT